jgi:multidrug efflux pump
MFSHFFIERPIFASVLSIVIFIGGLLAIPNLPLALYPLPLAQYPQITPPSIIVMCTYPGADARVVADTVAAPIEQQVNGVEDMIYMVSQSNNDGSYTLTVTFKPGVQLNFAQVIVQNRVNLALPLLPDVVKQAGVTTRKRSPDILMAVGLYSPNGRYDQLYLSNYLTIRIRDEIARLDGVGDVQVFGQQDYSMRIWVDPEKLSSMGLTAGDVADTVRSQNLQTATGHLNQEPQHSSNSQELPIRTFGRMVEPSEFDDLVIRSDSQGRKVCIRDIGYTALGPRNLDSTSKLNGNPNASLAIFALPDANAIATADLVVKTLDRLKEEFPEDMDYAISLDLTPFVKESINEVIHTLVEAVILVAIVVVVFLQNWRSAIIPLIAVPVAIVGTFAAMAAIGFSLNNLTLFGLVLAIGIVVDDAIVVVEAIEHHIEHGMSPRRAAHQAMEEVSGPVIAVALVLSAVFVPCAFISGITGQFFRQFALTIAVSTVISAFNSLTLSPALAAILLQPRGAKRDLIGRLLHLVLGWFFQLFNVTFRLVTRLYTGTVGLVLRISFVVLAFYAGLMLLTGWLSTQLPVGYIPNADQGRLYIAVQLPDAASMERTQEVVDQITFLIQGVPQVTLDQLEPLVDREFDSRPEFETAVHEAITQAVIEAKADPTKHLRARPERSFDRVFHNRTERDGKVLLTAEAFERMHQIDKTVYITGIAGQSFTLNANGSNFGNFFVTFAPFDERRDPKYYSTAIVDRVREMLDRELPGSRVSLFTPPPVSGLGSASGFKIIIEDRSGGNESGDQDERFVRLQKAVEDLIAAGNGGHFILTDKSFADLATASDAVSAPVLQRLRELPNKDFLTRQLLVAAANQALDDEQITDRLERQRAVARVAESAENHKVVGKLFSVFRANVPQLKLDINRDQCQTMGVAPNDVFSTLQIYLGSLYVNDFNRFGRTWNVVVQAQGEFRADAEKIKHLKVRNKQGDMVPLGAVLNVREIGGPINIGRYNMYTAAAILGSTEGTYSSGQGIEEMERLCKEVLPSGMAFEWTEINYMQIDAAKNIWNQLIFPLSVVFVFLVLAAQYESWALPLAVILVVPMCILGSLTGVAVTKTDINIFTQIGFVVLVGLASKNAILIVEFARAKREAGENRRDATLEACQLRLRPILMTSFAFILGVVPLLITTGAGAEMRRTLGTAVFSGMLGVTVFGIFLTPVFFYVIEGFIENPIMASLRKWFANRIVFHVVGMIVLAAIFLVFCEWLILPRYSKLRPQPMSTLDIRFITVALGIIVWAVPALLGILTRRRLPLTEPVAEVEPSVNGTNGLAHRNGINEVNGHMRQESERDLTDDRAAH